MSGSSRYPEEFRRDAVALVRSSARPLAQVARELGVNHETLRTWVRAADRAESAAETGGDAVGAAGVAQAGVGAGERKEILRKAAAYFAQEMDR